MGDDISDLNEECGQCSAELRVNEPAGKLPVVASDFFGNVAHTGETLKAESVVHDHDHAHEAGGYFISCPNGDFYSCEEAIKRLNEYLDHELTSDERLVVVKHLEICKPCFSRFTFEQTLMVSLRTKLLELCAPTPLKEKLKGLLRQSPPE